MRTVEETTQEVLDLAARHFQVAAGSLVPATTGATPGSGGEGIGPGDTFSRR